MTVTKRLVTARRFPPSSPAYSFGDDGFALVNDFIRPGPDAVPVVPAPDEGAIAEYVEQAAIGRPGSISATGAAST